MAASSENQDKPTGSAKAMSSVVGETNKKNMAIITAKAKGNLELQTVLLGAIETYEHQMLKGGIGALTAKKRRMSSTANDDEGPKAAPPICPDEKLDRNKARWDKWSARLLEQLFLFMDPALTRFAREVKDKTRLLEFLEHATDVRVFSDMPDRPSTLSKLDLFTRMKTIYEQNGRRTRALQQHLDGGFVEWRKHGHYTVTVLADETDPQVARLKVASTPLGAETLMSSEVTQGDLTLRSAVVVKNFSQAAAYIQTKTDTYAIASLFPKLGRQLRRRVTEDMEVVSGVRGGGGVLLDGGAAEPAPGGGGDGAPEAIGRPDALAEVNQGDAPDDDEDHTS